MNDDREAIGPQAVVEEAREFWRESARQIVRESISSIEAAAKQVATIDGVLIGFYANAIAFSDLRGGLSETWQLALLVGPVCLWLLSASSAMSVFWLRSYVLNIQSSAGAKDTIERIARRKHWRLRTSFIFLFLATAMLIPVFVAYLRGCLGQ